MSYFNKTVASKDMSGYYLLLNGEYAYNKSYSVGYDYGSIKRLDRYPMGALSTLYICFALKKHDTDFVKAYFDSLKWYREIYMISAEGARNHGLLNVPTDEFFETKHYLPQNLDEQRKIADFIIALERRIDAQQSLVDNLKKYKRGAIKYLLSKLSSETNNCTLRKISSFATCVVGATPDTNKAEYWNNGTIPWLSSGEVNKKRIYFTDKKITSLGYKKTSTKMLPIKTVVIALAGQGKTRGTVAITENEVCTNQSVAGIITDGTVDSKYLFYYLETQYENLRILSSGDGTRGGLNLHLINEYLVPVPCLKLQKSIASLGTFLDCYINSNNNLLSQLHRLKSALLQQLFI